MGGQWWNIPALESVCQAGADLELTDGDGNTLLQCALNGKKSGSSWPSGFWRDETLEVVLRHDPNVNAVSDNGPTPLIAALNSGRDLRLVQKLLDCGADITIGTPPAIFAAIGSGDLEVTAAVIDAGADVNSTYHPKMPKKYGGGPKIETPLLAAATKDGLAIRDLESRIASKGVVALLLQRGANPLMELQDGKTTVLHEICYYHGLITPIFASRT